MAIGGAEVTKNISGEITKVLVSIFTIFENMLSWPTSRNTGISNDSSQRAGQPKKEKKKCLLRLLYNSLFFFDLVILNGEVIIIVFKNKLHDVQSTGRTNDATIAFGIYECWTTEQCLR